MGCRDKPGNDSLGEVVTSYDRRSGHDAGLFVVIDSCACVGRLLRDRSRACSRYPTRLAASPMAPRISRSMKPIMSPCTQRAPAASGQVFERSVGSRSVTASAKFALASRWVAGTSPAMTGVEDCGSEDRRNILGLDPGTDDDRGGGVWFCGSPKHLRA